jgi:acetyl-CoA/propionyl-CoA carboxylase biotin carboxyl carrier protein
VSAVVVPGASPASISACLTHVRKASGWISSCSAIRLIAPVFVAGSRRASSAIRVARCLSSSLYFRGAAMTLILHWFESLHHTRGASIAAFGRGECFVEKYLDKPRHVETQCLADSAGNVVVSTRDCSLQRRHQKLVEEAPAPFLSDEQNATLYEASKAILKEVGYVGAGTCEFLIGADGTISFLEVNTRLQVEHPVSEEITGIDLVREQFRIAAGEELGYDDPEPRGHSFEFRINGEDPGRGFLPQPGPIHVFKTFGGPGIRLDSGVTAGDSVSGAFDSMLAKIIVTGRDRAEALERSRRALEEFEVSGLPTVIPFHRKVVSDPAFTAEDGEFGVFTRWIETEFVNDIPAWDGEPAAPEEPEPRHTVVVEVAGKRLEVSLPDRITTNSRSGGRPASAPPSRRSHSSASVSAGASGNALKSPLQATVVKVAVEEGQEVVKGDLVLVLEAMKMEQPLHAHKDGKVSSIDAPVGQTISAGHPLLEIA